MGKNKPETENIIEKKGNVLVSIIIPVHNGEKCIKRIANRMLNQSLKDIELILVENFSADRSLKVCQDIAEKDARVVVVQSFEKGTSLARKKGIETATGKYTFFCDQDDDLVDNHAIEDMYRIIEASEAQLCQFAIYTKRLMPIKKVCTNEQRIFTIDEIRHKEFVSILSGRGYPSPTVWSKMYDTSVLKDALQYLDLSLFYGEDQYLNMSYLRSNLIKKVCVDPHAFYVWYQGVGFSAKQSSGLALLKDYNQTKLRFETIMEEFHADRDAFFDNYLETMYFTMLLMIDETKCMDSEKSYEFIRYVNNLEFVQMTKRKLRYMPDMLYEELEFLISDYSPKDFCDRFRYRTKTSFFDKYKKYWNYCKRLVQKNSGTSK